MLRPMAGYAKRLRLITYVGIIASLVSLGFAQSNAATQCTDQNTFRKAFSGTLITLDPAATHTHRDWAVMLQVYDRLVAYDGTSLTKLVPDLATAVPTLANGMISRDGLTYTFDLRHNVTFHDGTPFTADDVAYAFKRMIEMNVPQAKVQDFILPYLDESGIEVVDPFTVKLHLKKVDPGFLFALADPSASIVSKAYVQAHGGITPGKENAWMRWHSMGTGPFVLQEIVPPGERIVLQSNAHYWGPEPSIACIKIQHVPDVSTQILMLKRGEVDAIEVQRNDLRDIQSDPHIKIETGMPSLRTQAIHFQQHIDTKAMDPANTIPSDFFQDINVRKGFAYAFPYAAYLKTYRPGDFRFAGPIQKGVLGYDPSIPMYTYDPEKAAEYFKKTPWWDKGFTITMYTLPNWDTWPQAISVLAQSLKEINPKFNIVQRSVEWATLVDLAEKGAIPIRVGAIRGVTPNPDSIVRQRMYKGGWDTMGLNDPTVNALIDKAAVEVDPQKRAADYHQLSEIAYNTAFMLWLNQDTGVIAFRDRVKGLFWHPIYETWPSWRGVTVQ